MVAIYQPGETIYIGNGSHPVRVSGPSGPTFLFRDDFTTAQAAPLTSPRTAEPGPGTLTLVQTDGQFSISGGNLVFPAQTTTNWGDQGILDIARTRVAGRTFLTKILGNFGATALVTGWQNANAIYRNTAAEAEAVLGTTTSANLLAGIGGGFTGVIATLVTGTEYQTAIVLRDTGAFCFIKGGTFTNWTLLWVGGAGATATNYAAFSNFSTVGTLDTFRVLDLPAPFSTDTGLASQRTASPAVDATITSEANAVIEFTWVAVTGETLELSTRRTTDNDRWIARGSQGGSTIKLIEVVAGVETERGSAAQTWTNTTSYRTVVVQDGTTIRVYVANVLKITYSSASTNQSATGVKTNKAGTELIAWPRQLTGTAAALLDAAVA